MDQGSEMLRAGNPAIGLFVLVQLRLKKGHGETLALKKDLLGERKGALRITFRQPRIRLDFFWLAAGSNSETL